MINDYKIVLENKPIYDAPDFAPSMYGCISNNKVGLLDNISSCIVFVHLKDYKFWFYNSLCKNNRIYGYKWSNGKWKYSIVNVNDVIAYY